MPSSSKSVMRYNLVSFRSLVHVQFMGGRPICLPVFCWPSLPLLSDPWSSLIEDSEVHWVFADKYESDRLKIDGFWIDWVPIDELIAAVGLARCLMVVRTRRVGREIRWRGSVVLEIDSTHFQRVGCTKIVASSGSCPSVRHISTASRTER